MISKLKKVQLREIWEKEATDFTAWLEKNVDSLNEQLELRLTIIGREKSAGDFNVDLIAEDEDGNTVIIENQLEKTDHDHLGKIITYLTMSGAKTAIWISGNPRPEHEKAINWLNDTTPRDFSFYLVQIEAVQIENSPPAPLFTLITGPTELAKHFGTEKRELADRHYKRKEFWQGLLEKAREKTSLHANITPGYEHWVSAGSGKSGMQYTYLIFKDHGGVELYIDRGKGFDKLNKSRFDQLYKNKDSIEKIFGDKLRWERLDTKRASRVRFNIESVGLRNRENWPELQDKMIDVMVRLEKALKSFVQKF
jgi:hypothetical protein